MHDSTRQKGTVLKVTCDKHGDVCSDRDSDPEDHIVATLVRDEHLEQCPGPVEIEEFSPEDLEAERASEIAERQQERHANGPGNHCPDCLAFVSTERPTECDRCGRELEDDETAEVPA